MRFIAPVQSSDNQDAYYPAGLLLSDFGKILSRHAPFLGAVDHRTSVHQASRTTIVRLKRAALLVPSLLLCASTSAIAADAHLEQIVRTQEAAQRGVATQTELSASKANQLADDLRYNRLGDDDQADLLGEVSVELVSLVRSNDSEAMTMMYVADRLARFGRGDDHELAHAAAAQDDLVSRLEALAQNAQGHIAGADGLADLHAVITLQQRLMQETSTLSDQTIGKNLDELSAGDRAELDRLGRQQHNVSSLLKDAEANVRGQATGAKNTTERERFEKIAQTLADINASGESDKASTSLQDNRLAEALNTQQHIVDVLNEAAQTATGSVKDPITELERNLDTLEGIQREEQDLLDRTTTDKDLSPAEADSAAAKQQDIARKVDALASTLANSSAHNPLAQAQVTTKQAVGDLQKKDKAGAEVSLGASLKNLDDAKRKLQGELDQRQSERDAERQSEATRELAELERQSNALGETEKKQEGLLNQLGALTKLSGPKAQSLAKEQGQIAKDLQDQKQTSAQSEAENAQNAVEQQDKPGAEEGMQRTLGAMRKAQQQLQQRISLTKKKLPPGRPIQSKESLAQEHVDQPGAVESGERRTPRRTGWDPKLEPQDREVLAQVKAEAFPARYEQALVQYYRALAGDRP